MVKYLLVAIVVCGNAVAAVEAAAQNRTADLAGKWQLELNPDFGGEQDTVACTMQNERDGLILRCGGTPSVVHVDGSTVTFDVKTGRNDELTATFSGTLEDGTTIRGTWRLDDGRPREGKFVLRKQ